MSRKGIIGRYPISCWYKLQKSRLKVYIRVLGEVVICWHFSCFIVGTLLGLYFVSFHCNM